MDVTCDSSEDTSDSRELKTHEDSLEITNLRESLILEDSLLKDGFNLEDSLLLITAALGNHSKYVSFLISSPIKAFFYILHIS